MSSGHWHRQLFSPRHHPENRSQLRGGMAAKCINLTHLHNRTVGTMEPPNGDELAGRGAAGVLGLHLYWIAVLCTTNPSTAFCALHLKGNQAHKGGLISTRFSSSGRSPLHHGEAVRPRKSP